LKASQKLGVEYKHLKTYSDECTNQELSIDTTFRPFQSGETVPLTGAQWDKKLLIGPAASERPSLPFNISGGDHLNFKSEILNFKFGILNPGCFHFRPCFLYGISFWMENN